MKRCSRCLEIKDESEFSGNKKNRDGYQSYCKKCDTESQRERRRLRGMKPRAHVRRKHKCTFRFGFCIECRNIRKRDGWHKTRNVGTIPAASFA